MADEIKIEIGAGGMIKTTTDQVSPANHQNAEQFLRSMASQVGGKVNRTHRHKGHAHTHTHTHEHDHHEH